MNISPSKENILKKIRKALTAPTPIPFPNSEGNSPVFPPSDKELEVQFAEEFGKLLGKFVYCMDRTEMVKQLAAIIQHNKWEEVYCVEDDLKAQLSSLGFSSFSSGTLADCDVSITSCECLVARTGTIVMSTGQQSGRTVSVYAPVHICIAYTSQLMHDVKDALLYLREKYGSTLPSFITFATGPSRTADIEKTLVVGIHGPKEVYCFLVDE